MIDRDHGLPVTRQAKALGIARSTVYALPRPVSDHDLGLIDQLWLYLNTDPKQAADVAYAMRLEQQHDWVVLQTRPTGVPIFA